MTEPWFTVGEDSVQLLRDGKRAFPAMLDAIAGAKREVLLEMYWIGDDECGRRFRDALAEAAHRGIRVRVVVDAVGSLALTPRFFDPLTAEGGQVAWYHPVRALVRKLDLERLDRRDHRKLLVVDGETGFCGGINLARHWLPLGEGGEAWRDDALAVRGPAALDLRSLFYETWSRAAHRGRPQDAPRLDRVRTRPVWVIASGLRHRRAIRREYLRRMSRAERSIDIANSYFLPDRAVRRTLFRAAARGVRVRLLVPQRSDVLLVQLAAEALYDLYLRRGVEVYAYPDKILHSKTAIVDDTFVTVGSYNFDERSFRKNLEVNLGVEDSAFAKHVRLWFEHDLASAVRIDVGQWRTRSAGRRGAEMFAFALRKLW
jgi:cardiolipin synthase